MPYTLAHPLYAAPLRYLGLPLSALAAGSVSPDLPLWATAAGLPASTGSTGYAFTHTVTGLLTADLLFGLTLGALWAHLVRAPFLDSLPLPVRDRSPAAAAPGASRWAPAAVAVLLGAITHVGLDEFTHEGRWGFRHIPWLAEVHAGMPGVRWAQYGLGALGLLGLALWCAAAVLRQPRRPRPEVSRPARRAVQVLVVIGVLIAGADAATVALTDSLHRAAFVGATRGVLTVLLALVLGAVTWTVLTRRTGTPDVSRRQHGR